jgi:hypothetical protein
MLIKNKDFKNMNIETLKQNLKKIKIKDITAGTEPIQAVGCALIVRKAIKDLINDSNNFLKDMIPVKHDGSLCLMLEIEFKGVSCLPLNLDYFRRIYKEEFIRFVKLLYNIAEVQAEYYQNQYGIHCEFYRIK